VFDQAASDERRECVFLTHGVVVIIVVGLCYFLTSNIHGPDRPPSFVSNLKQCKNFVSRYFSTNDRLFRSETAEQKCITH